MDVPTPVRRALGGEDVAASVTLGGDDALYVTASRTLVYRGESLLSEETVEEFPHEAERVTVTERRRKARIELDYGLDGTRSFAVPAARLDAALHPVLAGVLDAAGITDPGETITRTYRFSELTLVVTSARVIKHVGSAVWDEEYETVPYEAVTGLDVEEGQVASQVVVQTADRTQRTKVPQDHARDVYEHVEAALLAYHDASSYEEFARQVGDAAEESGDGEERTGDVQAAIDFDPEGIEPIDPGAGDASDGPEDAEAGTEADAGTEAEAETDPETGADAETDTEAGADATEATAEADREAVAERLRDLNAAVERQRELLVEQQALIEELAEELDRDG